MKGKLLLLLSLVGVSLLTHCSTTPSDPTNYPSPGAPPAAVFDNNGTQVSGF